MGGERVATETQQLFATMWAVGHVVHLINHTGGAFETVTGTVTFVLAIFTIRFRHDARWLIALAASQVADVVWELPQAPDHWNLAAAANLGLLITWLISRDTNGLVERAAPSLRAVVTIAYSAAAVAKWNTSFLDPDSSCGVVLAHIATLSVTDALPALDGAHIALSLGAESLIAIGLLVPSWRRFAALLGLSFHFLVSLSPAMLVADFTTILAALFVLFLPTEHRQEMAERSFATFDRLREVPTSQLIVFTVFVGGVLGHVSSFASRAALWVTVTAYMIVMLRHSLATRRSPFSRVVVWRPSLASLVACGLVLALALSPYLGGRTTGVFTMFSNLRTEGVATNHLFMPAIDLGDWQNEVVELRSSSSEAVTEWADDGLVLPRVDLARRVHADPELLVEVEVHGEVVQFGPNGAGIDRPSWFVRLFTSFRPFATDRPNPCSG